jgi:1-deoxyxylulose-5-phosphate synthase
MSKMNIEEKTLAGTDLRVSRVCFGTMTFGSQVDEPSAHRIVDWCMDHGINFFDTANVYNRGLAEEITGRALRGRRDKVVLASKVRGVMGDAPDEQGLSRAAIERGIEDSLRRLGTDYLDLYYLHQPDYEVPIDESLEALHRLIQAGKVRYPACSNYASWQICQMLWSADRNAWKPVRVTQPMYNLIARGLEQEYVPFMREFGLSMVVYNPLAGGLLTGKHGTSAVEGSRFESNQMYRDRYWNDPARSAVADLDQVAQREGRSLISLALNWLLHHTATDCIILGASRLEHLQQNVATLSDGALSKESIAGCDAVWEALRGTTPKYNR